MSVLAMAGVLVRSTQYCVYSRVPRKTLLLLQWGKSEQDFRFATRAIFTEINNNALFALTVLTVKSIAWLQKWGSSWG